MKALELNVPVDPPLGATLTLPTQPVAAALIHQGAGVHDRDGNMRAVGFKSTLYRRVARELGARGIATLRFDKRGHDKPAMFAHAYTLDQRIEDARAALNVLREDDRTNTLPLFMVGHSEGGRVVAKLAESEDVRGVVSLCAPWGNVFELYRHRARRKSEQATGAAKARAELALEYCEKLEDYFRQGAHLTPEQFVAFSKPYFEAGYEGWESYEWYGGHWANALDSDPTRHGTPLLVVQGGRDARLWPDNAESWRNWCASRNAAEFRLIDHMGHDLNDARQKAFRVDEEVINVVSEWMLEQAA
jgi:hypothetical protein